MATAPFSTVRGTDHLVASADTVASRAGSLVFERGGNAVDAAIATNAAMAVVGPHLCGMGGDLFALVHTPDGVVGLNASGRAGSLADAEAVRAEGHQTMPFRHDIRSVTMPGCVDGWIALHNRFGSLPLGDIVAPAIDLAEHGFAASPLLVGSLKMVDEQAHWALDEITRQVTRTGDVLVRPGVARSLAAIASSGRAAWYEGEFGAGLAEIGAGYFADEDFLVVNADWVEPLVATVFGVDLWTIGPNTQGYLTLASAALADGIDLPEDPADPYWAHLLIEASKLAGFDRPDTLHEHADGYALLRDIAARAHLLDHDHASDYRTLTANGDTTYLCTAQAGGLAVSLIQSNASGFGSWLVEPRTGVNLHNRGIGFSLVPGHPAEYGPRRRPPHTLSAALATRDRDLVSVLGTMGGDAQPQILLQLATRLFGLGQSPAAALAAPRWALAGPGAGFDTWAAPAGPTVAIEGHAGPDWEAGLSQRGHTVRTAAAFDSGFGHAHTIVVQPDGTLAGAADPRARVGATIGR